MPTPPAQRATTLLPLVQKVADAALTPIRTPTLEPNGEAPRPNTLTDTEPEVAALLAPAELTLGAS